MKILKILALFSTAFLVAGCASKGRVFSDYDPGQRFSNYQTFAWSEPSAVLVSGSYPVSALTKSRLQKAIENELRSKGFRVAENAKQADFSVSMTLGARDKITTRRQTEYRVDPMSWRWGRVYYPYYFPDTIPVTTEVPYQYTEGSIAVDIFDAKDQRPVWHSNASKRLSRKETSGVSNNEDETAKALLSGFPPN